MRKPMIPTVLACLMCVLLALVMPVTALAAPQSSVAARGLLQADGLDPELQAVVEAAVAATAPYASHTAVQTGGPAAQAPTGGVQGSRPQARVTPEPEDEPTPAPVDEATPAPIEEATPEPQEEGPPADFSERARYTNEGISVQAPADWDVVSGSFGTVFEMTALDGDFSAVLQDAGGDFPGLMGVVFFASAADLLLEQYLDGSEVSDVVTGVTDQSLPMVKIEFDALLDDLDGSGALYLIAPGSIAYMLIAFAPSAEWEALEDTVDRVAASVSFDADLITLTSAEGGEILFGDSAGSVELLLPEGWHATETDDETLPVLIADPDLSFVGAIGTDDTFSSELGSDLEGLVGTFDSTTDPAELDDLIDELIAAVEADGDGFLFDRDQSQAFPREAAVTVRLIGSGDMGDGVVLDVGYYFDLRTDGGVGLIIFGDIDRALEQEAALLRVLESTVLLE